MTTTLSTKALLAAEDYLGALDILQSAKRTVQNDLGKLQSLKHVTRCAPKKAFRSGCIYIYIHVFFSFSLQWRSKYLETGEEFTL